MLEIIRMPYAPLSGSSAVNTRRGVPVSTSVNASTTAVALVAARTGRTGLDFFNQSSATLYIRYAAVATPATTTTYDAIIPPNTIYEVPPLPPETAINGIWSAASGFVRITEYTEV